MAEFLGREYPEPKLNIEVNGIEVECSPENTTLFTYRRLGGAGIKLSMYDHIFYHDEQQDLSLYGFLSTMSDERKDLLLMCMIASGYNVVANQDAVAECDVRAYDEYVIKPQLKDIEHIPDEWD